MNERSTFSGVTDRHRLQHEHDFTDPRWSQSDVEIEQRRYETDFTEPRWPHTAVTTQRNGRTYDEGEHSGSNISVVIKRHKVNCTEPTQPKDLDTSDVTQVQFAHKNTWGEQPLHENVFQQAIRHNTSHTADQIALNYAYSGDPTSQGCRQTEEHHGLKPCDQHSVSTSCKNGDIDAYSKTHVDTYIHRSPIDWSCDEDSGHEWYDGYLAENLRTDTIRTRTSTTETKGKFVRELARVMVLRNEQQKARTPMLHEMEEADQRFDEGQIDTIKELGEEVCYCSDRYYMRMKLVL